jgi:hypothetical protein
LGSISGAFSNFQVVLTENIDLCIRLVLRVTALLKSYACRAIMHEKGGDQREFDRRLAVSPYIKGFFSLNSGLQAP